MADVLSIGVKIQKDRANRELKRLKDQLLVIEQGITPQLQDLANGTYRYMSNYIDKKRKRRKDPSKPAHARLAAAFRYPQIRFGRNTVKFSLGDKDYLDAQNPYWRLLEHGGQVWTNSEGTPGWFGHKKRPVTGVATRDLYHYNPTNQGTYYLLTGKHTITGIGYLSATNNWLSRQWGLVWRAYLRNSKHKIPKARLSRAASKTTKALGTSSTTVSYMDLI